MDALDQLTVCHAFSYPVNGIVFQGNGNLPRVRNILSRGREVLSCVRKMLSHVPGLLPQVHKPLSWEGE